LITKHSLISKLDSIDLKILQILQKAGRMTNVDLAKRVGISAPPCLRRLKNLEDSTIILGYQANINPRALGYNITLFASVGLKENSEAQLAAFEKYIHNIELVRECYRISGEDDFLLKIVAQDFEHYQNVLSKTLLSLPNVERVQTTIVMGNAKSEPGIPVQVYEEAA
jgi:DNA-binding Lrp family transcriptional regulator